jgi:hypothetical protein
LPKEETTPPVTKIYRVIENLNSVNLTPRLALRMSDK